MAQVQIQLDETYHRTLKYRAAQNSTTMGRLIEQLLDGLKMRALRLHRKIGSGGYLDDCIIIRCLIENDRRGGSEQDALDLVVLDLFEAQEEGVEAEIS